MRINFTKFKLFIFTTLLILNSCSWQNNNSSREKKIPVKNREFLKKLESMNYNAKPITLPQTAIITTKESNKLSKKTVKLQDEVANDNIVAIKKALLASKEKISGQDINKKNNEITKKPANKKNFYIQIGAYSNRKNAENVERNLSAKFKKVFSEKKIHNNIALTKIKLGPYDTLSNSKKTLEELKLEGFKSAIIINEE